MNSSVSCAVGFASGTFHAGKPGRARRYGQKDKSIGGIIGNTRPSESKVSRISGEDEKHL